jgi:hypothetical protein
MCHTGTLLAAQGAVIPPQSEDGPDREALVRLTATGPGFGGFHGLHVVYRDGIFLQEMRIPIHVRVEVRRNAPNPALDEDERRCLGMTGVDNLRA